MASSSWSKEEIDIISSLEPRGYRVDDIYKELRKSGFKRSKAAIVTKVYLLRRGTTQPPSESVSDTSQRPDVSAVQAITKMREAATLGITKWYEANPRRKIKKAVKILSLSDLHIPFFHEGVLTEALSSHNDADILILNGDILEIDMASKFPRHKTVLLKYEYKVALEWLVKLAKQFPRVVLVKGNHEARLDRYFQNRIDPGINFMVEGDILWRLAGGYGFDESGQWEKQHELNNVSYERGLTNWFVQIGQLILCHSWRTSSISLRTVELAHQWFSERGYSYQSIMMGHSHRLGSCITAGKLLIEQGCCCVPLDYAARADIKYRPTTTGYGIAILDKNGNVDFNETRPVFYGTGSTTPCHSVPLGVER